MKIKVSEASGAQLDRLVALCEGRDTRINYEVSYCEESNTCDVFLFHCRADDGDHALEQCYDANPGCHSADAAHIPKFEPSTNWKQGGPIIERDGIVINKGNPLYFPKGNEEGNYYEPLWIAGKEHGPTPLIAAMRCYVLSKLGAEVEEVEVPDETN